MWDAFAFVGWYFRGGYLDLFVDLDRIAVDYFAVEVQGDFDSEVLLPEAVGPTMAMTGFSDRTKQYDRPD